MPTLALKLPPLPLAALVAVLMWLLARNLPVATVDSSLAAVLAVGLALAGITSILAGLVQFRTARTTVNPLHPDKASTLVTGGIFARTRNPMYLGAFLVLAGYALCAVSFSALLVALGMLAAGHAFAVLYEEPALERRFGESYRAYRRRTRRWIPGPPREASG